jgi:S1-C subfamily serine protease
MKSSPKRLILALLFAVFAGPLRADLSTTIAKVKPAIAIVGTFKATDSPRFSLRGTGFVVASGNQIITSAHVVPQAGETETDAALVVQVRNGPLGLEMRQSSLLAVDKLHDLALLQFDGTALPALRVRESDSVREGQAIAFMGFPIGNVLGFSAVTHRGTVSSIAAAALPPPTSRQLNETMIRSLRSGTSFPIFQLDATAYPGNSGGPLFDPDTGEVIGVVNMVFVKSTRESALAHPSGISYAIPSGFVLELLQRPSPR